MRMRRRKEKEESEKPEEEEREKGEIGGKREKGGNIRYGRKEERENNGQ